MGEPIERGLPSSNRSSKMRLAMMMIFMINLGGMMDESPAAVGCVDFEVLRNAFGAEMKRQIAALSPIIS